MKSGIIWSLLIIGAGLVLRYAVNPGVVTSVSLPTIGIILVILGAVGFVLALGFAIAAEWRKNAAVRRRDGTGLAADPDDYAQHSVPFHDRRG